MDRQRKQELTANAYKIRKGALLAVYSGKSGHPGGSLSIADVLAYLYFEELQIDPDHPAKPDRDRLILSKGHCAPALYAALALRGYFSWEELKTFRHLNSNLQGHPNMHDTPGVDMSTGSLGQGISAACGMALSSKISGKGDRVYVIDGDGELEEGEVWEAAMFAAQYKLDNLTAYIDFNGLQIDGKITDVMSPLPIPEKFRAFGWHVVEIDGHDLSQIETAYAEAKRTKGQPTAIVAHSVKGKGVSFMENQVSWHGTAPNDEQYAQAIKELDAVLKKLEVQA